VQGVLPPYGGGEVPFDEYVVLGRKTGLRGFPNYRFRDRLGWWGAIEYRYAIYRFRDSPFFLSPSLFADAGRVADTFTDLFQPTLHWDVGAGIAGELETSLLFRVEIGYSREGIGTSFTLGKEL
jgi:hemolysin activation/secretion protein